MAGSYEHDKERLGPIKDRAYLDYVNDYRLLNDSGP
jgi:hypothetical protein